MLTPDNSQNRGTLLDLTRKPQALQLERFIQLLEDCIHVTKHCFTPAEAFNVIFGQGAADLLGFSKGYVGVINVTKKTVKIVYWINDQQWELDDDKKIVEHFAGIERPTSTEQGRLIKFISEFKNSYITADFKQDENFSSALRESLKLKTVIVTPLLVFNELIGIVLVGYPKYPSPETQWMHEYLITYSAFPVIQSYGFLSFRDEIENNQKWSLLGEKAGLLAHGLKNPIATLDAFFGLLTSHKGDLSKKQPAIQSAKSELSTIKLLTTNLLSYVKEVSAEREPVRVKDLLQKALKSSVPEAKDLPVSGDALQRIVHVNQTEIVLVLRNLINNAFESAKSQHSASVLVEIRAEVVGEEVNILVLDNGPGISEDSKEKIFNPFYTTKDEGHGLGLAVAQRFVVAHGGRMTVENREEGGACFGVILPL